MSLIVLILVPQLTLFTGELVAEDEMSAYEIGGYDDIVNVFGVDDTTQYESGDLYDEECNSLVADLREDFFGTVFDVLSLRYLRNDSCVQDKVDAAVDGGIVSVSGESFFSKVLLAIETVIDIIIGLPFYLLVSFVTSVLALNAVFGVPIWVIAIFYMPFMFFFIAYLLQTIEGLIPFT